MRCPRCSVELTKSMYDNKIIAFYCSCCGGIAVTMAGLRSLGVAGENTFNIWQSAITEPIKKHLPCPGCHEMMSSVKLSDGDTRFYIDVCVKCHTLWFDAGELERIPLDIAVPQNELPQKAREILALHDIEKVKYPEEPVRVPYCFGGLGFRMPGNYGEIIIQLLMFFLRILLRRSIF